MSRLQLAIEQIASPATIPSGCSTRRPPTSGSGYLRAGSATSPGKSATSPSPSTAWPCGAFGASGPMTAHSSPPTSSGCLGRTRCRRRTRRRLRSRTAGGSGPGASSRCYGNCPAWTKENSLSRCRTPTRLRRRSCGRCCGAGPQHEMLHAGQIGLLRRRPGLPADVVRKEPILLLLEVEMKSTVDEIRRRFDADVERFSNLDAGQSATVNAPLAMALVAEAAAAVTPHARHVLDVGCGAELHPEAAGLPARPRRHPDRRTPLTPADICVCANRQYIVEPGRHFVRHFMTPLNVCGNRQQPRG